MAHHKISLKNLSDAELFSLAATMTCAATTLMPHEVDATTAAQISWTVFSTQLDCLLEARELEPEDGFRLDNNWKK